MTASSPGPRTGLGRDQEPAPGAQFKNFRPRTLTWIGALPTWTAALGQRLGLTAGEDRGEDVLSLVERLETKNLIETREILDADGDEVQSFWLRTSIRPELGRYLQESNIERLDRDLSELATAVKAIGLQSATVGSIGSAQFLRIVRTYRPDPSGRILMADVDELVANGQRSNASALVAACRGLGELTSGTLLDAARRAQWRIDRALRVTQDNDRLRHYCQRPSIEAPIRELVETAFRVPDEVAEPDGPTRPGSPWALHLLGDGGMGKTMLIRYLASGRFGSDYKLPSFLVARTDFDHLDPRYPEQHPGELLLALATDLLGFATRDIYKLYRLFQDAVNVLNERGAGSRAGGDDQDYLSEAVELFSRFIDSLGCPVLLILDTCEELAKLYLPNDPAPAIDQTFRLLELIMRRTPRVRVLFAGRRPLVPSSGRPRSVGPVLHPRPYLWILAVGGFTAVEADLYLTQREDARLAQNPAATPLHPDLRQAALERAVTVERPDGGSEYSPFELAAYYDWALSDPNLDADELRSARGDPYIEWRIIGRLGDEQVRAALGIAAEFGRFDTALLTPALTRAGIDIRAAFDGLATQEWVNVLSLRDDGGPAVIEIDGHLLDRIRAVVARKPEWFPLDRERLGEDACQVIENTPLAELAAETIEAAIRLLPLEQAARLWQRIEDRCCAESAWGWATQIAPRVAEVERARMGEDDGAPTILAAILATLSAARLHTGADPSELWRAVELLAPRHPVPEPRVLLALRARLGRLASGDLSDTAVITETLSSPGIQAAAFPLVGAVIAAVHGCVTRGQELPEQLLRRLPSLSAAAGISSAGAAVRLTEAVHELWAGSLDAAGSSADRAIEVVGQAADAGDSWPDWVPPRELGDRCRLVRVLVAWRCGDALNAVPWLSWRSAALTRIDDIDAERLVAATVRFESGHRPIAAPDLELVEARSQYVPGRHPSAWVHQQVGPLVVELAEAWRIREQPARADGLLSAHIEAAVAVGTDPETIEACELARLRLCRRERTTGYSPVTPLSRDGSPRIRSAAWLVKTLVDGSRPGSPKEAGSWSAWWRCQDAGSLAEAGAIPPAPPPEAADADRREFAELFPDWAGPEPVGVARVTPSHDFDPEAELRLGRPPGLPTGDLGRLMVSVAEVTALRFPERVASQLLDAAQRLDGAGDKRGALEARLLAGLAMARSREPHEVAVVWPYQETQFAAGEQGRAGWGQREDALTAYLARRQAPPGLPPSPELSLPGTGTSSFLVQGRDAAVRLVPAAEAIGSGAAVAAAAISISTVGAADATTVGALLTLIVVTRVITFFLPYRIVKARAVRVSQPSSALVLAEAVPSHGMRDLTGLRLTTIVGALAGRWPLATMLRPWRGEWIHALSDNPAPRFDLGGLKLPSSLRSNRMVTLEVRADDTSSSRLPWEQWLGSSLSPPAASGLLLYRRVGGRVWAPTRSAWANADAEYRGWQYSHTWRNSSEVMIETRESAPHPPALRLLHIVGTPVRTEAGWRLRVAVAGNARIESRGAESGETLLRLDDFPTDRTALAVLQAEPVDGPPQTLAALRSGLMGCAQDLIDGGANAVLLIPPLPDEAAVEVAETLWKMIARRRRRLSPSVLLRAQAQVKKTIADLLPRADADPGPVLDVVLFVRAADRGAHDPTTERSS
jgi:hypothetical protein